MLNVIVVMANLMSFVLTIDELFDDVARELKTVLIVNKVNRNIKNNGMADCWKMFMNLSHVNGEKHS